MDTLAGVLPEGALHHLDAFVVHNVGLVALFEYLQLLRGELLLFHEPVTQVRVLQPIVTDGVGGTLLDHGAEGTQLHIFFFTRDVECHLCNHPTDLFAFVDFRGVPFESRQLLLDPPLNGIRIQIIR